MTDGGGGGQGGTGRVLNTCKSYSEPQFHLVLQWSNHDVHSVWRNRTSEIQCFTVDCFKMWIQWWSVSPMCKTSFSHRV